RQVEWCAREPSRQRSGARPLVLYPGRNADMAANVRRGRYALPAPWTLRQVDSAAGALAAGLPGSACLARSGEHGGGPATWRTARALGREFAPRAPVEDDPAPGRPAYRMVWRSRNAGRVGIGAAGCTGSGMDRIDSGIRNVARATSRARSPAPAATVQTRSPTSASERG